MMAAALSHPAAPLVDLLRRQARFVEQTVGHQPDPSRWTTANELLARSPIAALRGFGAVQGAERGTPVLIVPPEINQSYIADFAPGQSLVATARAAGLGPVACLEWLDTTPQTAGRDIDSSLEEIQSALATVGAGRPVHLIGLCQGGWESAIVASLRPDLVASLTLVAAPIDFSAGHGLIKYLARSLPHSFYQGLVALGGGMMRNEFIATGFDGLLPFERFFVKYLSLYNHVDDEPWLQRFHRLNDWYRSPKALPGPLYLRAVRELFVENRLVAGSFVACGQRVDLGQIRCPLALLTGSRDHITPPPQVLAARDHVASRRVFELSIPAGHIGTFMGREALADYWPQALAWLRQEQA